MFTPELRPKLGKTNSWDYLFWPKSMPDMTGRPGCRTMEMFGRSAASYLARTPRIPLFVLIFIGLETKNVLDYQGRTGSTSIVQWTLRPVIFGVDKRTKEGTQSGLLEVDHWEPVDHFQDAEKGGGGVV